MTAGIQMRNVCVFAHVCYSPASPSSERAQLTPQWGEARSFRQQYPASARSLPTRPASESLSPNVVLTVSEQTFRKPEQKTLLSILFCHLKQYFQFYVLPKLQEDRPMQNSREVKPNQMHSSSQTRVNA